MKETVINSFCSPRSCVCGKLSFSKTVYVWSCLTCDQIKLKLSVYNFLGNPCYSPKSYVKLQCPMILVLFIIYVGISIR